MVQKKRPTKPAEPWQAAGVRRNVLDAIPSRCIAPGRSPGPSPAGRRGRMPRVPSHAGRLPPMGYLIFALIALLLLAIVGMALVWGLSALCRFLAVLVDQFPMPPREQ